MVENGDKWSRWLLRDRFGGDQAAFEAFMQRLRPVRDRVLDNVQLQPGDFLLDVGCGDGLIGLGALERIGRGEVILADISVALLSKARELAGEDPRCRFLTSTAEYLPLQSGSIDAVTTRSVLIYVPDKAAALREFFRVLRPGGRLSIFEPINAYSLTGGRFLDPFYDEAPPAVAALLDRFSEHYHRLQPVDSDPMLNFGERDLLAMVEAAGFGGVHLELQIETSGLPPRPWQLALKSSPNPHIPPLEELLAELFSENERRVYEAFMRPRLEAGGGRYRNAVAYIRASRPGL